MTVLLTGGTGKTSVRIARFLQDAKVPFVLASRKAEAGGAPSGMPAVKFDWQDSSTFENPFQHKSLDGKKSISAVYLVAPEVADPTSCMTAFVDLAAKKHGVKRFVLLAGSTAVKGGWHVGKVWQHLDDVGVEYCVLMPTWFMDNFLGPLYLGPIKDESKIYTACGDGKIGFVSAMDIAAVAYHTLTDEKLHKIEYPIMGPEPLTYDQIAAKFSHGLGRKVEHVKVTEEQKAQRFLKMGLPEFYAKFLASLEAEASKGREDRLDDTVEKVTGRPPMTFDKWVEENKKAWL